MFCNKCGNQVEDGARFCPKCGVKFKSAEKESKKHVKSNRKKCVVVACVCIAVLVIGGIGPIGALYETSSFESGSIVLIDGLQYCHNGKNYVLIYGHVGELETVVIPSTVKIGWKTYQVDGIRTRTSKGAFENCTSLTSIEFPDHWESIGERVFNGCTSLTSVKFPNDLESIGFGAFRDCTSLTSVGLPDGLKSIGGGAFENCTSLTSVGLPDSLESIGDFAFSDCTSLTSVALPNGLESIGAWAFSDCTSLTSVKLPNGLESIGRCAFRGCSSLTSVKLPNGLESIGPYAFNGCSNLVLKVPETAASIPNEILKQIKGVEWDTDSEKQDVGLEYSRSDFKSDRAYQEYSDFGDTSGLRK